jgi:DNA-binding response OmpR family regulator
MTAHHAIPTAELLPRSSRGGYLRKPFDSDTLVAMVRSALRRAPDIAPAPAKS